MHKKLVIWLVTALFSLPSLASTKWYLWQHKLSHRVICTKGQSSSPAEWRTIGGPYSNAQCAKDRPDMYNLSQQKQRKLSTQHLPPLRSSPPTRSTQSSQYVPPPRSSSPKRSTQSSDGLYTRTSSPWWKWTHHRDRGSVCAQAMYDANWRRYAGPYKDPSCTVK